MNVYLLFFFWFWVFARYMFEVFDIAEKLNYITNNDMNRK